MAISTIPSAGITGGGFNFRNLIINGDMSIAQRSTSTSSYSGISYSTVDRFKTVFEYGTYTVSQESLSSGAAYNAGFRKAFKALVTSTGSPAGAGDQVTFEQRIEGQMCQALKKGTAGAESLTLSFWVRSSKTGTNLQVNLRDNDNDRIIGATYDIITADTWEKKIITFAGDTSGALDNDNAMSLLVEWFLDGGSNYSGGAVPTSWEARDNTDRNVTNFDLAGATNDWWITGVQLEVGTTASDFEFLPWDINFSRCLRYYEKSYDYSTTPATNTETGTVSLNGLSTSSKQIRSHDTRYHPKRTAPTVTIYDVAGNSGRWRTYDSAGSGTDNVSGIAVITKGIQSFDVYQNGTVAAGYQFHYTSDAEL